MRKTAGIPWGRIEGYLTGELDQAELARRVGTSKQNVTMWRKRGAIPPGYAGMLAALFDTTADELLGAESFNSPIRSQNRALSKTAQDLIFSVIRLDAMGGQFSDVLGNHAELLAFAEKSLPVQDGSYELNASEIVRRLQALVDSSGGARDEAAG